ncbi:15 kDa protein B [Camelus ferus]|uniref:15 kDa protein B n=2 Tax=Camelus TaxID=9836 RepID=A0A8B7K9B1_CAMFR|nr:15 kDa protein B-like [Camelus bactrianus]XP_014413459.2 15 kDa protein B [Camelus ferus]
MAGAWRALVLVVGLAAMACVAQRSLSYEEIVNHALRFFNYGRRGQRLFGLLEAIPPPLTLNTTTTIPLNFRIKETVCFSTWLRRQPRGCAFREGGEERNCTGNYFRLRHVRLLSVDCPQDSEREREREPGPAVQVPGVRRPAEVPEEATLESDSYKLPPVVRDQ